MSSTIPPIYSKKAHFSAQKSIAKGYAFYVSFMELDMADLRDRDNPHMFVHSLHQFSNTSTHDKLFHTLFLNEIHTVEGIHGSFFQPKTFQVHSKMKSIP